MTTRFILIAACMVLVALACVLVPLLRSARREGRPRGPFVLALVLALLVPPAVLGGYLLVGTPQALEAAAPAAQDNLADATQQLRDSLAKNPNDAKGWALLAQAYSALNQPQAAQDALAHLLKLQPNDPDAMVAWVEAAAATAPNHAIDDAGRAKLQHALQLQPTHQRALWLLGISDFQRQNYADAVKQWKALLPLLQPGSRVAATVLQELAVAEQRAGIAPTADAPASTASTGTAATAGVALHVEVQLAPQLAAKVGAGDTLFVFARAVGGPPMPLAVAKLDGAHFPASVTLTDAMAMSPAARLSSFAEVQVAARISKSGNAMPQAGDFEASPVKVDTRTQAPITLRIDHAD